MTNYNERLEEVLERYRLFANMAYSEVEDGFRTADEFKDVALPKVLDEAKQALLDWHNKQVEELLDRLESQSRRADDCTDDTLVVKMIRMEAERAKLKERDDDQL